MILQIYTKLFDYIMLLLIILNFSLRKYRYGQKKRFSTILFALIVLGVYFLLILIDWLKMPSWLEYVALALGLVICIVFRDKVWPWRLKCRKCGKKLSADAVLGRDENLCDDCWEEEHPEAKVEREEKEKQSASSLSEERITELCNSADKVDDVPWGSWEPTERCVLTYVIDGDKVLLIEKKRGMGQGYFNAPGGHIELEETSMEAAVRETKEETGLTVSGLEEAGVLRFQFKEGIRMIGYVFTASSWEGELIDECDETRPFWTDKNNLDLSLMWEDDRLWLPLLFSGKKFEGWFVFDDRKMLDAKVEEVSDDD
ncbi:MAG: 8-oxo-dGTP diphosphatase [Candidatus Ornithospirochaeta sp.]